MVAGGASAASQPVASPAPAIERETRNEKSGVVYAVALAFAAPSQSERALSGWRATLARGFAGLVLFLGIRVIFLRGLSPDVVDTLLIPGALFALLGAATGLAIQQTAKHGQIAAGAGVTAPRGEDNLSAGERPISRIDS